MYLYFSCLYLSLSTFQHHEVTKAAWNPLNLSPIRPTYSLRREAAIETISRRPCPVSAARLDVVSDHLSHNDLCIPLEGGIGHDLTMAQYYDFRRSALSPALLNWIYWIWCLLCRGWRLAGVTQPWDLGEWRRPKSNHGRKTKETGRPNVRLPLYKQDQE